MWVTIAGVLTHYKKDESYRSIGRALGMVDKVDVDSGRVRVHINADEPLQFERKAGYANGDVIKVSLTYEELHRYCYTCKRISHEEGTCPELSPEHREVNRLARLEKKEKEELAAKEAFSAPIRGLKSQTRFDYATRKIETYTSSTRGTNSGRMPMAQQYGRSDRFRTEQLQKSEHDDLRTRIASKRDNLAKNVWNRLDQGYG